ncbi:MAG TPA: hypothetical protein VN361_01370 [Oxalicibacterium sp.]|nr:hypothetical protein [Oxalicibacterium sp.]
MRARMAAMCLLASSTVWGVLPSTALADQLDIKSANNQIQVQARSTHVDYTERDDFGILDTERGDVPGFALSYSAMWSNNYYLQLQYGRNQGHTRYVGQALIGGTGYGSVVDRSGATMTDYQLRAGRGFVLSDAVMLTPYGEIGHHRWERGVNDGETYTHDYFGIGALAQYSPMPRLVLSANLMVGRTFHSDIDVAGSAPFAFSASLGNSDLYKAGLAADYAFTRNFHGMIGLDYSSFEYGNSAVSAGGFYEPDSKTRYTTVNVGVGYAF